MEDTSVELFVAAEPRLLVAAKAVVAVVAHAFSVVLLVRVAAGVGFLASTNVKADGTFFLWPVERVPVRA